ncbi:caprin-1b isoform X1 [Electrophorus electricus]|uniref:caprin-1b isoform X1 n=1 Tax=Electrophorus electricus TaxID=8005 RepID=UPI000F09EB43|nr:caprin-1b isoform X1 [Electrophorus electricus]
MPSATNGNKTVKSASLEVGLAPASMVQITSSNQLSGSQSEAMKQVLSVIEKKVRNMEKKKSKLDDYQARNNKGERLNQDQLEALSKYQEVINNLEFARELHKSFLALSQDVSIQKAEKKAARREQLLREEAEQVMLRKVLELQFILDRLGDEGVRQELVQVTSVPALLTETDLVALDDFYKLVGPERDQTIRLTDQYQEASQHLWDLLEGKDKAVAGTTYKALREILEHVLQSGYFDQVQSHQNGVCTEEEEKQTAVAESSEADEQQADTEGEMTERYAEPILMEATEFVNRQFIPETSYSNGEKEQGDKWSAEIEVPSSLQQPDQMTPVIPEPHAETSVTPTPSSDPLVRKQVVQDLMAQMQGPYNFMQDSMLEFDAQPIDPAIVSAQPMKPTKSMEMPQMVCPPVHPESCLAPSPTIPVQPEPTQVPIVPPAPEAYSTPPPMFQPTLPAEPRPQADSIDPIQASMSLVEQPPPSAALSGPSQNAQVFQPSSKPIHSSGINVNAAPFQSMQTVFNLNAPVPPANEADSLKQSSQYTGSYSQSFSSQTQHPVEQTDMQSEQLQAVVGAFQDQSLPSSTGQQSLSQQPAGQGSAFGRQTQSFYNSRALPRGGPRNSRGMINGYRGPSNGFRGSYDGYRPNFSGAPNSGYGQAQFNTARDYSNSNYQRDGYQQNYKRATGQGPRGVPRGNGQAMRS